VAERVDPVGRGSALPTPCEAADRAWTLLERYAGEAAAGLRGCGRGMFMRGPSGLGYTYNRNSPFLYVRRGNRRLGCLCVRTGEWWEALSWPDRALARYLFVRYAEGTLWYIAGWIPNQPYGHELPFEAQEVVLASGYPLWGSGYVRHA
jgi:hypothetical protein